MTIRAMERKNAYTISPSVNISYEKLNEINDSTH